jgi:hypothetical protein
MIRVLFSRDHCGPCGVWRSEIRGGVGGMVKAFKTLVEKEENEERCMYLVCHFNGRRLKDLSLLCCISILLESMETRVVDIVEVKCSLNWYLYTSSRIRSNKAYLWVASRILSD